ncbi:hypothetical protein BC629DRAFT_744292 [Irpex lacteus]|nr:hypothetical protein BC629DRAFT_744292 [Irpex lacteus]
MAILERVAKGMSEYLDQLRGVKNLSFSEFRSFSWLRQDHRDRILQHTGWVLRKRDIANVMRPFINTQFVDHKRLKMSYTSFDTLVARVFGVTIENWPPIRFAAPGLVKSFSDMVGFYLMWKSGATRFRRLSAQEKKEWDATRLKLYKEHRRSSAPSTPRVRVPSRERPVHRLLIDPKVIGTVDQIAAFMDPALVPKRTEFGRGKAVMQENDESQTPLPNP